MGFFGGVLACLLIYFGSLINHFLSLIKRFKLAVRESEAQRYYEISPACQLRHLFVCQSLHSVRCRPCYGVPQSQLPSIVSAPGVNLSLPCEDRNETRAAELEIHQIKFCHTFHSVRGVELPEGPSTPQVKLMIL